MEDYQPGSAATGGGGLGTDDAHHPNGSGGAQFVCCSDCVPVHPNSSYTTACPGDTQTITEKNLMFLWRSQNKWTERHPESFFLLPQVFFFANLLTPPSLDFSFAPHSPHSLGLFFPPPKSFFVLPVRTFLALSQFRLFLPPRGAFELLQLGFICHPEVWACSPTPPESLLAPPKLIFISPKRCCYHPLPKACFTPHCCSHTLGQCFSHCCSHMCTHVHTCTHLYTYKHFHT